MGSNNDEGVSKKSAPDKWIQRWSRSKPGKCYYFNARTKESSWIRPDGLVVETPNSSAVTDAKAPLKRKSGDNPQPSQKKPKVATVTAGKKDSHDLQKVSSVCLKTEQRAIESDNIEDRSHCKQIPNGGGKAQRKAVAPQATNQISVLKNVDSNASTQSQRNSCLVSQPKQTSKKPDASSIKSTETVPKELIPSEAPKGNKNKKKRNRRRQPRKPNPVLLGAASSSKTFPGKNIQPGSAQSVNSGDTSIETNAINDKSVTTVTLKVDSNQHKSDGISVVKNITGQVGKILENGAHEAPSNEPAQRRLKRLQESLKPRHFAQRLEQAKLSKKSLDLPKVSKDDLKLFPVLKEKLEQPIVVTKDFGESSISQKPINHVHVVHSGTAGLAEARLQNLQSKLKTDVENHNYTYTHGFQSGEFSVSAIANSVSAVEAMEVEYMESEVICDIIGELRKNDVGIELIQQPVFMDVDVDFPTIHSDPQSVLCIVLDTNILLSHLKFVEGLRDSVIPGKGPVNLFLPWQVLRELDHLKDKGKPNIQPLARRAINYLHENFSSKHPRVRGQNMTEASKNSFDCPDDNILQFCIELKNQAYDVVLLSNDINLLNKALVCDVRAFTKDQLSEQLSQDFKNDCKSSILIHGSKANGIVVNENSTSTDEQNDDIFCEMKTVIKETLSEVVSKGMEDEYKCLWKKRTIIAPPWEADQVLHCLCHHWLAICGDFIPPAVKLLCEKLKMFFKQKGKKYGISTSDLKESLEVTKSVLEAIPKKYSEIVNCAIQKVKMLEMRMDGNHLPILQEPDAQNVAVLLCFEVAHNAAQQLCSADAFSDPDWKQKALCMIRAVQDLINLLKLLLLAPVESLNEDDPVVNGLLCLIKGENNIAPKDIINFAKSNSNRTLMENGIQQFTSFEAQLTSMLQLEA